MRNIVSIPVRRLFVVALLLKLISSGIGWVLHDPWIFGLAIPLVVMLAYIAIGLKRIDDTVSDEKFADSCYYIGFIFTITSIIFSLIDLPNIGTRMPLIAVRFGTAMASTVLGLGVRVYLITFRQDVDDAMQSAEEGIIDASRRLREQLSIILESFQDFESKVGDATNMSIAKVSVGVEELTQSYGQKLATFFEQLSTENTKAFRASQTDVHEASLRLSSSVDGYANEMKQNLQSIEGKVVQFADAVTHRLEQTSFPDDYFAQRLGEPLAKLSQSTSGIAAQVADAAKDINQALKTVRATFATMRSRASEVDGAFDRLTQLTTTQETLLVGSQAQVSALSTLESTLRATQEGLGSLSSGVTSQKDIMQGLAHTLKEQTVTAERMLVALQSVDTALSTTTQDMSQHNKILAAVSDDTAEQKAALCEATKKMGQLTEALEDVAAAIDDNSTGLAELTKHVAGDNEAARQTRATSLDAAQRIELATRELPLVKAEVNRMSTHIEGLVLQLKAFASDVAVLANSAAREKFVAALPVARLSDMHGHAGGSPVAVPGWTTEATAVAHLPAVDASRP
ncbi:hypothetical protein PQR29_03195 [Paraburkholderia strydomiana]|uniref:hypothetical protein n=1 Tax=Paraburkholderia strydomiana TaxID=1245417 RepID=UPI0038B894C1